MRFDLSWRREDLDKVYGILPDMTRLAYDIHRAIQQAGLYPIDFKVLGKFILNIIFIYP